MTKLRQGLGGEEQAVVRTVHGYGYRLVADVQIERPTAAAQRADLPHCLNYGRLADKALLSID